MAQIPDGAKLLKVLEGSSIWEMEMKRDWGIGFTKFMMLDASVRAFGAFAVRALVRLFCGFAAGTHDSERERGRETVVSCRARRLRTCLHFRVSGLES